MRTMCRMPVISSVPGTARGLLCTPLSWSSAVRRQVGASAERWKVTYCMSASERFATDPYPAAVHTPGCSIAGAWRAARVVL